MSRAEILKAALELPEDERQLLVEALFVSLQGDDAKGLSPAWEAEISARLKRLEAGSTAVVAAEDVFAEADESIRIARGSR